MALSVTLTAALLPIGQTPKASLRFGGPFPLNQAPHVLRSKISKAFGAYCEHTVSHALEGLSIELKTLGWLEQSFKLLVSICFAFLRASSTTHLGKTYTPQAHSRRLACCI